MKSVLGISAFYHDSAAALVIDGEIVAAAQEERFSRIKNDDAFPLAAADWCLREGGMAAADLDAIVFYDKPILKFARFLESHVAIAPRGIGSFVRVTPSWLAEKLNIPATVRRHIPAVRRNCPVLFTRHHEAHAASAFLPSPFPSAAILTVDGVGEWATTTIGRGADGRFELLAELRFPHSLGLLYSAFTAYCGFRVNSGEYKLMGLAPYGSPRFADAILDHLIDLKPDGSFRLDLDHFAFLQGRHMTNGRFHRLFGGPPRSPEAPLRGRHADVARSIQAVTEEVMLRLARHARETTGERFLCLAGGVALNCVANGRLYREAGFDALWIQPAAGDAGGAVGAALAAWRTANPDHPRRADGRLDTMRGALLGPSFDASATRAAIESSGNRFRRLDPDQLAQETAGRLAAGETVAWFQGAMEFGPRSLGNRSILADPRSPEMQGRLNRRIKFREDFRPFAPAVLAEESGQWFDLESPSPYMLLVAPVRDVAPAATAREDEALELPSMERGRIPAVTHVDGSARVQTVDASTNLRFRRLLEAFRSLTGCPVLVNTSFNLRGEPVVCTPEDALACFNRTNLDVLVLGDFMVERNEAVERSAPTAASRRRDRGALRFPLKESRRDWVGYACVWAVVLVVLGIIAKREFAAAVPGWLVVAVPLALVVASLSSRRFSRAFYRAGMRAGGIIGHRVGQVILALIHLFLVVPTGLALRLAGRDPLERRLDRGARTYWRPSPPPSPHDRLY